MSKGNTQWVGFAGTLPGVVVNSRHYGFTAILAPKLHRDPNWWTNNEVLIPADRGPRFIARVDLESGQLCDGPYNTVRALAQTDIEALQHIDEQEAVLKAQLAQLAEQRQAVLKQASETGALVFVVKQ